MQAENAKHAAEMLKRSGELAGTAAEMLEGGAVGEAVTQLLEQAKNLARSALELLRLIYEYLDSELEHGNIGMNMVK